MEVINYLVRSQVWTVLQEITDLKETCLEIQPHCMKTHPASRQWHMYKVDDVLFGSLL